MNATTFDVRVWAIRRNQVANGVRYQVRWKVGRRVHYKTCATRKLADSFRSTLNAAAHAGEPFDPQSGLPRRMQPKAAGPTWFEHAQAFTDMKWPAWSPRHRQSTAEGLTTIT
ncbi:MAG: hypothetical protein WCG47_19725, partial [Dermatophilaceae bacterium]